MRQALYDAVSMIKKTRTWRPSVPNVIIGRFEGPVHVAMLQCRQDWSLIHESYVNLLTQSYPECRLPKASCDRSALLCLDEGLRTEKMAVLIRR